MIEIFTPIRELLIAEPDLINASIIGIDGYKGSGKSNLSIYLGSHLHKNVLHVDDFIIKNQGAYMQAIEWKKLDNSAQRFKHFVIEGVCLLEIVEKLNIKLDYIIYCKELSKETNIWHAGYYLYPNEYTNKITVGKPLEEEMKSYHHEYYPDKPEAHVDCIHYLYDADKI